MRHNRNEYQRFSGSPIFQVLPRKRQPLTIGRILNAALPPLAIGTLLGLAYFFMVI